MEDISLTGLPTFLVMRPSRTTVYSLAQARQQSEEAQVRAAVPAAERSEQTAHHAAA